MTGDSVMLRWALHYEREEIGVLPIVEGEKRPALPSWDRYKKHRPPVTDLQTWFAGKDDGALGVITGAVSNNLVILDFDGDGWERALEDVLHVFPDLRRSRQVITGSGRVHLWLRCLELNDEDGQPLTRRTFKRPDLGQDTAIELRANGHQTLAPPSLHPSGGRYAFQDDTAIIVTLPNALMLLAWLESWERKGQVVPREYRPAAPLDAAGARPGDDYSARGDVLPLLTVAGWQVVKQRGDVTDLRRPGKDRGVSATWNYYPRKLFVFTTNGAPFEPDHCYDGFAVYALLEHHGDFGAAARELARQGYGASNGNGHHPPTAPASQPATNEAAEDDVAHPTGAGEGLPASDAVSPIASALDLSLAPDLPDYARLTPAQEAEARKTGSWLDMYVKFAGEASPMTPAAFHIAAGIFLGGLAIARRLYLAVSVNENAIYPNLFMLYLGTSTTQRKSTALRVVTGTAKAAGLQHLLLADQQTPEALAVDLTSRVPFTYENWQGTVQERWLRERAFAAQRGWLLEEAAKLLDSFNRDFTAGLLPMVLALYDCPPEAMTRNTLSRGRELVEKPYLNIFGVTTYGDMAEHLEKRRLWSNGFFARFALVGSDDVGTWRFWPEPKEYPAELLQGLRRVATQLLPTPTAYINEVEILSNNGEPPRKVKEVEITPPLVASKVHLERGGEAWQAWERYAQATSFDMLNADLVSDDFKPSYGRFGTMLIKIAIILAAFDTQALPVTLEPRHIYRAQQIVELWRANLHEVFGKMRSLKDSEDYTSAVKIVLAKAGRGWVARRDLLRALKTRWSELEPIIKDLLESGEIEQQEAKNERGPATCQYRLATTGQ